MITQIQLIPALPDDYIVVNGDPQSEDPEEFDMTFGLFWTPEKLADEFRFAKIIQSGGKIEQPVFFTKLSLNVAQLPGNRFNIEDNLEQQFRAIGVRNFELTKTMWGTYPVLAISGQSPTGEPFARLWFGINSPNGWVVEIIFLIPDEETLALEKSMEMWETLLTDTRLPPGMVVPALEDLMRLEDITGIIRVEDPPVRDMGRTSQRSEGVLIISNDLGDYLRVEVDMLDADALEAAQDKDALAALIQKHFDTQYYPHTYGRIEAARILSQNLVTLNDQSVLVVGINLPKGSILSEANTGRLDAVRYIAVTLEDPLLLYVTIEFNSLSQDLSREDLKEIAIEQLQRARNAIVLDREALE